MVDVDNVCAIENILNFFQVRNVHVTFYVKNQIHLQIPSSCKVLYEIALAKGSDDDDMSALTEALNLDCFIVTCNKFESYLKSGLIDMDWLDAHRIQCIWKNEEKSSMQFFRMASFCKRGLVNFHVSEVLSFVLWVFFFISFCFLLWS